MNYRHIYHAGNFADVFKHLVFRMCLAYLQQKDKGLLVLDAFAGIGNYHLRGEQAEKTGEYRQGIARLFDGELDNEDLRDFRDFCADEFARGYYAGSPLIAAKMLREQDRLIANELHDDDVETLRRALRAYDGVSVAHLDAYEAIRANIPPKERRGIVLVDPPFEKKNEFELLVQQMQQWQRRWETGCYILWYPIKHSSGAGQTIDDLYAAAAELGVNRTWVAEFMLRDRETPEGLNGCGLLFFNVPFQIPERVEALAPELTSRLGGAVRCFYL